MSSVKNWIQKLELIPHPEGGYYKEVYRSEESISGELLPNNRIGERSISTAIYFLLEGNDFSAFHRIKSDEIWHFYDGGDLIIYSIANDGILKKHLLNKENPMQIIPKGEWFASELIDDSSYILVGCTVAPGFDFADFEMADTRVLLDSYPMHKKIIRRLSL